MGSPEIAKVSADVSSLKREITDTKTQLEKIKSEGSVWTSEWREQIVRKCMEAIEPNMMKYISKFNALADALKKFGSVDEIQPIVSEFKEMLSTIESALSSMESYGNETDKSKAKNLCNIIRGCKSKLG